MKLKSQFAPYAALANLLVAGCLAGYLAGCSKPASDAEKSAEAPEKADATASGPGVTLDTETQARLGLKVETPAPAQWQPEMKVYGTVLDTTPLAEQAMELHRAAITLAGAQKELDRAKRLKTGDNITDRAYQDAETTYAQNLADEQAARFKIQAAWGPKVATMIADNATNTISGSEDNVPDGFSTLPVVVRLDLVSGTRLDNAGQTARITPLADDAAAVTATCFDVLPSINPQTQQQGLLFTIDHSATGHLVPGETVSGFIKTGGTSTNGVVVPASAILRYEGKGWVYVQTTTNRFSRMEIPLDQPMNEGWFVSENVSASNHIVTTGAQTVLSAELSAGAFTTGERD